MFPLPGIYNPPLPALPRVGGKKRSLLTSSSARRSSLRDRETRGRGERARRQFVSSARGPQLRSCCELLAERGGGGGATPGTLNYLPFNPTMVSISRFRPFGVSFSFYVPRLPPISMPCRGTLKTLLVLCARVVHQGDFLLSRAFREHSSSSAQGKRLLPCRGEALLDVPPLRFGYVASSNDNLPPSKSVHPSPDALFRRCP